MSGRSAHVRKKITESKTTDGTKGRASSIGSGRSSSHDNDRAFGDYGAPKGTGYGTSNARFLKFSEPSHEPSLNSYRGEMTNFSNLSSTSQGNDDSGSTRGDGSTSRHQGPMPDYAYARARKPVLRTEDVSGIERSGFRSAVDKKSEEVRKNLTKAFSFGSKKKKKPIDLDVRSPSVATTYRQYSDQGSITGNDHHGVPLPTTTEEEQWDPELLQMASPPPSSKLPPLPPAPTAPPVQRWIGAGRPVQRWNKLRKDPELWDPNGDVLVYFGHKGQIPKPNPSFRLSSHIIEATESRFLLTLLREGSTEEDDSHMYLPPSPMGAPPMIHGRNGGRSGHPTPPTSEDVSLADADGQISYEMFFPTPKNLNKIDAHRHAITTRNVFALLYHASLVGLSLFQALADLHARLESYMPLEADNVGTILNYLSARGIDDARNDPETAVSLLAWSETAEVRWEEGWREAFLHCVGMYPRLENCADFKHVTPISRALLDRACLETQLRVQAAEDRLAEFAYDDIWPPAALPNTSPARAAADRLQMFFVAHYAKIYGSWPPSAEGMKPSDGDDMWLTRVMAQRLQKDFGALYDYLVNREIEWDESEARSSRKWMMVSRTLNDAFDPDTADLAMTDILIEFDNRMRYPHIPHPYPLVPDSIPPVSTPPTTSGGRLGKKDKNANNIKPVEDRGLERRVQLAYTEATNIYILGSDFTHSDLIDNFVKFEKADQIGSLDPFVARRGRWILIYAILQTLASVSVDSPNARYKDAVTYHLSPRLKGTRTPPWKGVSSSAAEATHEGSHCWVVSATWREGGGDSYESDELSGGGGNDGETSPVMRMMRVQAQNFPRPPGTATTSVRSSHAGWQTAGTRSVRSSGTGTGTNPPTMYAGSSAMSVVSARSDDTGPSTYRIPLQGFPTASSAGGSSRKRSTSRSGRSYATFGPSVGRVVEHHDEPHWPRREQSMRTAAANSGSAAAAASIPRSSAATLSVISPRTFPGGGYSSGDDGSGGQNTPKLKTYGSRPLLSPLDADGLGPMIKDFDTLDMDDHAM